MARGKLSKSDLRKLSKEVQTEVRKRAVQAVKSGKKVTLVAELYGISRRVLTKWCKKEREEGMDSLEGDNRGLPEGIKGKVKKSKKREIIDIILNKTPETEGLSSQLWTRKAVLALIKRYCNINYSLPTISRMLIMNGLSPQKPTYRASQRDPVKIQKWLDETYPKIKVLAQKEGGIVHWGDEMGIRSTHVFGRSYGLKNKTPVVNKTINRFGYNIISTIADNGSFRFMTFKNNFNISVFLDFLRRLIHRQKKKIFLIMDNHKVHHSNKVAQWLKKNKKRIELFFLPPYAPELNPDEMLNRNVKSNVSYSNIFSSESNLLSALKSYLFDLQRKPEKIKSFFTYKSLSFLNN